MKASTFAIFLTFAVILAAASAQEEAQEVSDIENEFLGELDTDAASPEVNDIESEVEAKTRPLTLPPAVKGWGRRRRRLNRILVKKHFRCHYNQNWVNGMRYSQKVIKASSRAAAAQMCVNDCARMKGCTGFFYQKHRNGHQICGFYKSKIGAGSWHGHAEGAVCRYSHTTRHYHLHRGQEQALDTDEEEVASSEIEAENAASPEVNNIEEEQSLSRWSYVVRSGRDCIGGAFKCGHGSLHTAYRACEASRHCGAVAFRGNRYCLKHPVRHCRQDYRNGYKMYKKPHCPNYRMMAPRRVDCKHGAYKCGASYSECDAKRKCAGDRRCGGVSVSPNGKHYCLKHKKRHCSKDYGNKYTFFTK